MTNPTPLTRDLPKNEPQLSAEMEKRFDDEISFSLHEMVDGDWCPALGVPHYDPFESTSSAPVKPNYKIITLIGKCECGGDEKIARVKHFLATALEEQREKDLSFLKEMREYAGTPTDLVKWEMVTKMIDDWIAELNQLKEGGENNE